MPYEQELHHIRIGKLVFREINGTITPAEKEELSKWLQASEANRMVYEELSQLYDRKLHLSFHSASTPSLQKIDQQQLFSGQSHSTGQSVDHA